MRSHRIVLSGLAVALAAAVAQSASGPALAGSSGLSPTHRSQLSSLVSEPLPVASTCVKQNDNDNGVGIISQNFETDFDAYDSRGADDFTLEHRCTIREVDVNGAYFTGIGPADSLQVVFYLDDGTSPGRRIDNQNNLAYRDRGGLGNFKIPLPESVTLRPGTYWVAVRANMEFRYGGEWGWNTNNTARGDVAQWRNVGDGFDTGCTTWGEVTACLDDGGEGPDFSFALLK